MHFDRSGTRSCANCRPISEPGLSLFPSDILAEIIYAVSSTGFYSLATIGEGGNDFSKWVEGLNAMIHIQPRGKKDKPFISEIYNLPKSFQF